MQIMPLNFSRPHQPPRGAKAGAGLATRSRGFPGSNFRRPVPSPPSGSENGEGMWIGKGRRRPPRGGEEMEADHGFVQVVNSGGDAGGDPRVGRSGRVNTAA